MLKDLLQRITGKPKTRSLDAAAGGRRWDASKVISNLNREILAGGRTIQQRSAYAVRNDPWAAAAVSSLVANITGDGIKPQSQHPDQKVRERLHRMFLAWTDHADIDGLTDFYGLQSLAVRSMIEGGECFIRMVPQPLDSSFTVPFMLELIGPDQVPLDLSMDVENGGSIRAGIEFNARGRRVAYHIYKHRREEWQFFGETVRVPASEIIHLFEPLVPGQIRGISRLTAAMLRMKDLFDYEDAELVRKRVASMFTAFVTRPDPEDDLLNEDDEDEYAEEGVAITTLEPGTVQLLEPGEDVRFSDPADVGGNYEAFIKHQLRAVAAGLGVPYETMTGDLEATSYSSIRAGLVEFRRKISQLQHNVVVFQFCRPVWERFIRLAVLAGHIPAAEFDRNPHDYLAVKWITPKQDWVDPLKDAQAAKLAVEEGFMSRREVVASRGYDVETLDEEIAADKQRAERLGLKYGDTMQEAVDNA